MSGEIEYFRTEFGSMCSPIMLSEGDGDRKVGLRLLIKDQDERICVTIGKFVLKDGKYFTSIASDKFGQPKAAITLNSSEMACLFKARKKYETVVSGLTAFHEKNKPSSKKRSKIVED
jgi:hypothetical protein